jgi:hypothetical protein
MLCAPGLFFGGTEGFRSIFYVLRFLTHFRRYRAPSQILILYASELIFGGTETVGSNFHVYRSHTHFQRYRGRRVPFSCYALPNTFRRYRGRPVLFSCFALSDPFSAVWRVSGPVFMLCASEHVFDGTEGVRSRFHILRFMTRFRRN